MAQFLTTHKVASVLEDPTSQSLHGQSQDFFGFAPDAVYGICLAAPSWIRKYALLAARSIVSSPHIMPKTHLFSSSSNKALLFWSVRKGWLLFYNYWLDGIAWAVSRFQAIRAPLSSSAPHGQASSREASLSLSLLPVCLDNQTKLFSGTSVVNQPRNWGWGEWFFCPQLKFAQVRHTYLALDVIQQLFLAEMWKLVTQGMALEVSSGLQAAILCRENKGRWIDTKKKLSMLWSKASLLLVHN